MNGIHAIEMTRLSETIAVGLDVALKAAVLLVLAWAAHLALGRRRALARSAAWNACLVGLLLLPLAATALPRFRVVCLPGAGSARTPTSDATPAGPTRPPDPAGPDSAEDPEMLLAAIDWYEQAVVAPRLDPPTVADRLGPGPAGPEAGDPAVSAPIATDADGSPSTPLSGAGAGAPMARAFSSVVLLLGLGYVGVAGLLGIRLLAGLAAVARLRRSARPVSDMAWEEGLGRWRDRLGIGRPVGLAETDRLGVPAVVGWLRPVVLLPTGLAPGASAEARDAVLLHELAHVRRGDYAWNLLARVVAILYWPHPMAWPMGRAIRSTREQACDDLCVHHAEGPGRYRSALLAIAEARSRRPGPALGLAMADPTRLASRLAWIDRTAGSPRCLGRWPLRLGLIASAVAVAGLLGAIEPGRATSGPGTIAAAPAAPQQGGPPPEAEDGPPDVLEVTVTASDTGEPIPGALVRYPVDFDSVTVPTDREGVARLDLSIRQFDRGEIDLDVWADGYVQQRPSFDDDDPRQETIPERLAVALVPGSEEIGGVVTDEDGGPIAGVTVEIWGYLAEKEHPSELVWKVPATTDAEGRWRSRSLRPMQWVSLFLFHPDYVGDFRYPRYRVPLDELYAGTNQQVMMRGVSISGRVVDEQGRPVSGAKVGWAMHRDQLSFGLPRVSTDEEGRYRIAHARPGELYLVAEREGCAPSLITIDAEEGGPPREVDFRLEPGRVFEGRVVDLDGEPIPGAFVNVGRWRGIRAIGAMFLTDAEGRFRWESAPPDALTFGIRKRRFARVGSEEEVAAGREAVFTLEPAMEFAVTIRDAETGAQVDRIDIEVGRVDGESGEMEWAEWEVRPVNVPIQGADRIALRVSAPGYAPIESEAFEAGPRLVTFDGVLSKRGEDPEAAFDPIAGVVRLPDGTPMAGATVAVASRTDHVRVSLDEGKISYPSDQMATTRTDAEGRFSLVPAVEPFAVIALGDDHFAEATVEELAESAELRARPWGRVEGRLLVGGEPVAEKEVLLLQIGSDRPSWPNIGNYDSVTTDAEGRFAFRHVLPGIAGISWRLGDERGSGFRNDRGVAVRAGETTRVTLGGTGRPVVGRIATPEGFDRPVDFSVAEFDLTFRWNRPDFFIPVEALGDARTDGELSEILRGGTSPEAIAYFGDRVIIVQMPLAPDGSFRVEDVPPGSYRLEVSGRAPADVDSQGRRLARLTHFVTVPGRPDGRGEEPFDLGVITMRLRVDAPGPGEPVPAFEVETLDGRVVGPGDYRGKLLLLNFWVPWKDQGLFQVPYLKNLREAYGDDELAILHLCPSDRPDEVRRLVERSGLPGDVAVIGQWSTSPIIADFDVLSMPAPLLIGPDGTILEAVFGGLINDHSEERARERLDALLGR